MIPITPTEAAIRMLINVARRNHMTGHTISYAKVPFPLPCFVRALGAYGLLEDFSFGNQGIAIIDYREVDHAANANQN